MPNTGRADYPKETASFLGVNGDGRAPAGSFGSRIQLALPVGVITTDDAKILRIIKSLRNLFAHRIDIGFLSAPVLKLTIELHTLWVNKSESLIAGLSAGLRQTVKTVLTVRCKLIVADPERF